MSLSLSTQRGKSDQAHPPLNAPKPLYTPHGGHFGRPRKSRISNIKGKYVYKLDAGFVVAPKNVLFRIPKTIKIDRGKPLKSLRGTPTKCLFRTP